jgi:hypothetical protein
VNYHRGLGLRSAKGHHAGAIETEIVHRCTRCPAVITKSPRKSTQYPVCSDCWSVIQMERAIEGMARKGVDLLALDDATFARYFEDRHFADRFRRAVRQHRIEEFLEEESEHALAA